MRSGRCSRRATGLRLPRVSAKRKSLSMGNPLASRRLPVDLQPAHLTCCYGVRSPAYRRSTLSLTGLNLTPFAGVLSNGLPHQVSVNVFNATSGFSTTATLLLYLDHGSTHVTGGVTRNT